VIGVLDSGVGGISVLREIARALPTEDLVYAGDSAFCPYGAKSTAALRARLEVIVDFLIAQGAEVIVFACNSATIQGVEWCRERWPQTPFVGMEPGVKPAVSQTQQDVIGVLATEASLTGEMFARLVERCCQNIKVLTMACPTFVSLVEEGKLDGPEVEAAINEYAGPMVEAGADVLVLGCTHYPFLAKAISRVFPEITLINTGPAVARRVSEVLDNQSESQRRARVGSVSFWTSGEIAQMERLLPILAPELQGPIRRLGLWGRECISA